jgi:hypothetical protein
MIEISEQEINQLPTIEENNEYSPQNSSRPKRHTFPNCLPLLKPCPLVSLQLKIFPLVPCPQASLISVLGLRCETKFHTHTKLFNPTTYKRVLRS